MYFVDNGSAVPVMPQVKPVSSATPQFFTEGGNGTPPTYPGPDWFNIFQLELLNVLKEAQINPDKANHTQLVTAMKKLFLDASSNGSDIPDKAAFLSNLGLSDSAGFVGRLIGPPKIFTSSGTYTPTAGTTSVIVEAQGAGGGGGYARATSTGYMSAGAGGGAGGYGKSRLTSGFSGVVITIGSGGSQGVSGGDTSFGSLIVAAGGGGGSNGTDQYASGSVTQYVGASGGSCTGG
ncbi:TPA: hypothetical protein ACPZPX_003847, partial [Yersinia enterocolitica]